MSNAVEKTISFITDPFGGASALSKGIGKVLGTDNNDQIDSAQATLDTVLDKANQVSSQNKGIYSNYLTQMQDLYGNGASSYSDAIKNLEDAISNYGDFSYNKDVSEFYDPYANQRQQQAMNAIEGSASSGGNRFSSNYLDKVGAKQQALASEEWEKAYSKLMSDRSQQLQEWQSKQNKINNLGTLTNLYGNDRNKLSDAIGDYYSSVANQNNADLQAYSDVTGNKANLDAQRQSGVGSVLGGIGSVIGAIF